MIASKEMKLVVLQVVDIDCTMMQLDVVSAHPLPVLIWMKSEIVFCVGY